MSWGGNFQERKQPATIELNFGERRSRVPANPLSYQTVEIMKQPFQFRKYSTNYLLDFTDF